MSHEPRIESLEIKLAHLERTLQELSDVLYRQQQQLDAQAARVQGLVERLETSEGAATAAGPQFEIPPHY